MPKAPSNPNRVIHAALAIAVAALIAWGTLQKEDPIPDFFQDQDKLEHIVAFGLFAATLAYALPRRFVWAAVLTTALMAVAVEYGQKAWFPTRSFSYADAAAGILGAVVAGALAMALFAWRKRAGAISFRDEK